jgi:hypothetical protein
VRPPIEHTDQLLRLAIAERRLVAFMLDGRRRIAEPHDYGTIDGVAKLFFYQVGGKSRSGPPIGWRWGVLTRISDMQMLGEGFAGPRPVPSGRHIRWDELFATVSGRPVSEAGTRGAEVDPTARERNAE